MPGFDPDQARSARDRLVVIAQSDTGQARRVATFWLAWGNAGACGGVDVTDLRMLDRAIADDRLAVGRRISLRHAYPTAYGDGPPFEQLVADWRPRLLGGRRQTVGKCLPPGPSPLPPWPFQRFFEPPEPWATPPCSRAVRPARSP